MARKLTDVAIANLSAFTKDSPMKSITKWVYCPAGVPTRVLEAQSGRMIVPIAVIRHNATGGAFNSTLRYNIGGTNYRAANTTATSSISANTANVTGFIGNYVMKNGEYVEVESVGNSYAQVIYLSLPNSNDIVSVITQVDTIAEKTMYQVPVGMVALPLTSSVAGLSVRSASTVTLICHRDGGSAQTVTLKYQEKQSDGSYSTLAQYSATPADGGATTTTLLLPSVMKSESKLIVNGTADTAGTHVRVSFLLVPESLVNFE